MDQLAEAVASLMQVIVPLQEKNAPVSESLPGKTGGVVDLAHRLVQIARALGQSEYAGFPEIAAEIAEAADKVETAGSGLSQAMTQLRTSSDRKRHWRVFLDSCSTISGKTILLLKIVYGADFLRIFDQCEMAKHALDRVEPKKAPSAPQEFCNNASAAATAINEVGWIGVSARWCVNGCMGVEVEVKCMCVCVCVCVCVCMCVVVLAFACC
jgi:hypothetical protein